MNKQLRVPVITIAALCLIHLLYAFSLSGRYNWDVLDTLFIGLLPSLGPFVAFTYFPSHFFEAKFVILIIGKALVCGVLCLSYPIFKSFFTKVVSIIGAVIWVCMGIFWTYMFSS